jgi:hypothetical protein
MASKKPPKFDTSFPFGANQRKKRGGGGKQSKATRLAHHIAYRAGTHPRQTGGASGS